MTWGWEIVLTGILIACTPPVLFIAIVMWRDHLDQKEDRRTNRHFWNDRGGQS